MENVLSPWRSLNKAFLKLNPSWHEISPFRNNLLNLLKNIQTGETEEFHKNLIRNFLQKNHYRNNYFINTKGLYDLVVHTGKDTNSSLGLILKFKSPTNKAEMPKPNQLNVKGLQQLLFAFLEERINQKNFELKHLIVTNCYEWFVFDAQEFEQLFIHNRVLVKQFKDFGTDQLSGSQTKFFYENIAGPAIENILSELKFTYWDLRNYQTVIEKATPDQELTVEEQRYLVALFKIFSPEHLLKLPFANDSNTLNREFYNELLHIIGLTETKQGNKKLIERLPANERNLGSLLEGAIAEIENIGKLSRLSSPERYGNTAEEQLVNVALELVITWINRILFLKLLEAQLIRYHQGDRTFAFLHISKLESFSDLNQLFFSILARQIEDRPTNIKDQFTHVPYLNSSLFEPTDLELDMVVIGNLNGIVSSIFPHTILKDSQGNRSTGELDTLQYLFEFLDAYDFGSDGVAVIREKSKSLINAAVLGLIFEKINGYQDGSFYTPGFITMYMCRETIRRAVVQKFNEMKGWHCSNFDNLQEYLSKYIKKSSDQIIARNEANQIINSLKICDPAVGSGHFLVSALNEIIAVKHELGILQDKNGKTLVQYAINVENDELIITNSEDDLFEYHPKNQESQRVQETIFHEKQTLIENCLFGVDININSVKICQLRLWIELLKNAYYKANHQLETLPNIDINIKNGNSLISRFPLNGDLGPALRKNNLDVVNYRNAVQTYRNAISKEQKQEMVKLMETIKGNFKTTLYFTDPKKVKLNQLEGEVFNLENQTFLFEESKTEKKTKEKKITKLNNEIDKLKVAIEEEESGQIYNNTLEWRFEFPEVLNDQGDFLGFDLVIGNPPYIQLSKTSFINDSYKKYLLNNYETSGGRLNTFIFFIHLSSKLLKTKGLSNYIIPNTILTQEYYLFTRKFLLDTVELTEVVNFLHLPFEDAVVETVIIQFINNKNSVDYLINVKNLLLNDYQIKSQIKVSEIKTNHNYSLIFANDNIVNKVFNYDNLILGDICNINQGIALKGDKLLSLKSDNKKGEYKKLLDGKNIRKYSILWDKVYLDYNVSRIHSCKRQDIFETSEKLLFRRVSTTLIFTYDNSKYYALNTLIIVNLKEKENNYNLKFILGLMNSKLMNYIYGKKFKSTKTVFSEIQARSVCQLPVPRIDINIQSNFVQLVDKILKAKKSNPDADTTKLEKETDRLVYELYGLTAEEIAIVENYDN